MTGSALFRLNDVRKRRSEPNGPAEFELLVSNAEVSLGDRIGVVAPNGAGKSTLIDMLIFASRPSQADCFEFCTPEGHQNDIWRMWQSGEVDALGELRKRYIGVVLQSGGLLPFLSVRHNIDLPRRLLNLPDDGSVQQLARRLGIDRLLDRLPEDLSVGERQRAAIARAVAHHPMVVVADEPTASLDKVNAETTMALFIELVDQSRMTLIMTSHDQALVERHDLRLLCHDMAIGEPGPKTRSRFWT